MGALGGGSRGRLRGLFSVAVLPAALALAAILVVSARAERNQEEGLIVSLNGGFRPQELPRSRAAPVAVRLSGRAMTDDGSPVPRVNWIRLELAWRGAIDAHGLPVCPKARLRGTTSGQAVAACGSAIVGRGRLFAKVFVPNQPPFPVLARLTAFNGVTPEGRRVILVHSFSVEPPVSFVIPFTVHRDKAASRTVLVALIRRAAGPWPRVANFQVEIFRSFAHRGRRHSFLRASCPIPEHFTAGFLSFARATYSFEGGKELIAEAVRSCRARAG